MLEQLNIKATSRRRAFDDQRRSADWQSAVSVQGRKSRSKFGEVSPGAGTIRLGLGGTGHRPVLGGNLPPSFVAAGSRTKPCGLSAPNAAGASPAATGQWPVPPAFRLHWSALE